MGFFIRCAFWLSLALLFIPIDVGGQTPQSEPVGPLQALVAAREAVRDVANICERQPEVCSTASAALQTIMARAKQGVRIARETMAEDAAAETGAVDDPAQPPAADGVAAE